MFSTIAAMLLTIVPPADRVRPRMKIVPAAAEQRLLPPAGLAPPTTRMERILLRGLESLERELRHMKETCEPADKIAAMRDTIAGKFR